jgi:hypothetical protein
VDGLLEWHAAYPYDIISDTQLARELAQFGEILGIATRAYHCELPIAQLGLGNGERTQQTGTILIPPQRGNKEHKRSRHSISFCDIFEILSSIARTEKSMVNCLGYEVQLRRVDVKILLNLAAQALRIDDDRIGHPRRTGIAQPPIEARGQAQ